MKTLVALAVTAAICGCAQYGTADQHIGDMKRLAEAEGLTCPEARPTIIYGQTTGRAYASGGPLPGGTIFLPSKYDPATEQGRKWAGGPSGHRIMAHEVAHTCGADERQARTVECRWWICDGGWNNGLRERDL